MEEVPIIFYPSKIKVYSTFIISLTFLISCFFIFENRGSIGLCCVIFFGLGTIISLIQIVFPNSSYWQVTEKGIKIKGLIKSSFLPWENIQDFKIGKKFVKFTNEKRVLINLYMLYNKQNLNKTSSISMTGFEGESLDDYFLKYDEVKRILNKKGFNQN
ncbi:hypothetical protein [Halpernia frigidisoli]|uniref:Uncharacterized protein n=1 Tax=Halpernia frigidisoli TaxID=1125876 RepID=A0A1I3FS84_9FLAO|nr:hypothetical protein [Halpernia frigidisoli]SFI13781.1 hypothetical protein SAMN05443292_1571 [Halpernia frigidisoli]